jgi:ABC-2 type transport system permease protein
VKHLLELYRYRELIKALVVRDLKVQYKDSFFGYLWAWLDPLLYMGVFILVFDVILKVSKMEYYPIYLLTGLVPWKYIASSANGSVTVITRNAALIRRVYYPREIFPIAHVLSKTVDLVLGLIILLFVALAFGIPMTIKVLLLPLPILCLVILAAGVALFFSCINVYFLDLSYVVPVGTQLWFFLCPVMYSVEGRIPAEYMDVYMFLNPVAVAFGCIRASFMGSAFPKALYIIATVGTSCIVFILGYIFFKRHENMMVKRL